MILSICRYRRQAVITPDMEAYFIGKFLYIDRGIIDLVSQSGRSSSQDVRSLQTNFKLQILVVITTNQPGHYEYVAVTRSTHGQISCYN